MTKPSLDQVEHRLAALVGEINSVRSSIVNAEITNSDFPEGLTKIHTKLDTLEQAINDLTNEIWEA
jgi:hypothetical protein